MNILGLIAADVSGHPAACLLKDGKLIAFAEEERFVRVKRAVGFFPINSIRYCLKAGGLDLSEVDEIAFGWDANAYRWRFPLFLGRSFLSNKLPAMFNRRPTAPPAPGHPRLGSAVVSGVRSLVSFQPAALMENIVIGLRDAGFAETAIPPVVFVKHHLTHAASAFYCSGFPDAAVLVFDGHGEENATTIYRGEGKTLELLKAVNIPHSLGWFYSAFTEFLGWDPNEGEVKLMGLAPFGQPNADLDKLMAEILQIDGDVYRVDPQYLLYGKRSRGKFFSDALVARIGPPRGRQEPITDFHRDIARAAQQRLEDVGARLAARALKLAGSTRLCLAGGVALNCKMNGEIHRRGIASEIFVQPLAYDAGAALGAAMVRSLAHGDDCRFRLEHLYWGPEYSNDEIETALRLSQVRYRRADNVAEEGARLIADGRIVGWFQGRLEAGARALGSRSILADPRPAAMKDLVNDRVKFRENWRPFALSVLEEHFAAYVTLPAASPFMAMAYDVAPPKFGEIQSAMHEIDHTTRPQTVSKSTNPRYWELIEAFRRITGVAGVLNTSFNIKDEPIVLSPRDALRCFYGSGMDALVIGDFIVEK